MAEISDAASLDISDSVLENTMKMFTIVHSYVQNPTKQLDEFINSVKIHNHTSNRLVNLSSNMVIPKSYMINKSLGDWLRHFGFTTKKEQKHVKQELKFVRDDTEQQICLQLAVSISYDAYVSEMYTSVRMLYGLCYSIYTYDSILTMLDGVMKQEARSKNIDKNVVVIIMEYANLGGHSISTDKPGNSNRVVTSKIMIPDQSIQSIVTDYITPLDIE